MPKTNYDDPKVEERWCNQQRVAVGAYLKSQRLNHGEIGEWPAWHVAPHVSLWVIESLTHPGSIGWWVICGDLPTDYISASDVSPPQHPRKALRVFTQRWLQMVNAWARGHQYKGIQIAGASKELSPLLKSRATLLTEWAENGTLWTED